MAQLTVSEGTAIITFIQLWTFPSEENQKQFIHTMRDQFEIIMRMPGFVAMGLHRSLDGTHAIVYAQWQSREACENGMNNPEAKKGHGALAQWGESSGTLYQVDKVFLPILAG